MKKLNAVGQWRVDQVIECLDFGNDRPMVESALLKAMPDAYESHPDDSAEWPEADSHADRKLDTVWDSLSEEVQLAITNASKEEEDFLNDLMKDL